MQRPKLGAIGGRHAQAVPFDQRHGGRIDPGLAIRARRRAGMPAGAGRGQALAAAVAGDADALDECVDPVAVALGVARRFSTTTPTPSPGQHAVGVSRRTAGRFPTARGH